MYKVHIFLMTTHGSRLRFYCYCKCGLMEGLILVVCETANGLWESPRLHFMKVWTTQTSRVGAECMALDMNISVTHWSCNWCLSLIFVEPYADSRKMRKRTAMMSSGHLANTVQVCYNFHMRYMRVPFISVCFLIIMVWLECPICLCHCSYVSMVSWGMKHPRRYPRSHFF